MTTTEQTKALLDSISEPITPISDDHIVDCPTCCGDHRHFDDPADCPECAGTRYVVL